MKYKKNITGADGPLLGPPLGLNRWSSQAGAFVHWGHSQRDWLEGRGERICLIYMIDDATNRLIGKFARTNSAEDNMAVLQSYIKRWGRPRAVSTDGGSRFRTRNHMAFVHPERAYSPSQIGRALGELEIALRPAGPHYSTSHHTRTLTVFKRLLVESMRALSISSLAQANAFLEKRFLPRWEAQYTFKASIPEDAHRPLDPDQRLEAIVCPVSERVIKDGYLIQFRSKSYRVAPADARPSLVKARVRIEHPFSGEAVRVKFQDRYLEVHPYVAGPTSTGGEEHSRPLKRRNKPRHKPTWMKSFSLKRRWGFQP